ncbi:MAG: thiamine phosphate synthase [Bauldia sp.]
MRGAFDLRLMLVSDAGLSARRGLIATVLEAIAGGRDRRAASRTRGASDAELTAMALGLRAALAASGVPLIVNDRPEVARAAGTCRRAHRAGRRRPGRGAPAARAGRADRAFR